jgi:porphyrinogen peroxidase
LRTYAINATMRRMVNSIQKGSLEPVPLLARYLTFHLSPIAHKTAGHEALGALLGLVDGRRVVLGLGADLCRKLKLNAPAALHAFAPPPRSKIKQPATHGDVWVWLRAKDDEDRGALLTRTRQVQAALGDAFELTEAVDAFKHREGRDLTGYEDGTENPKGKKALAAAFAPDGSSFVAVQKWQHQWRKIDSMSELQRNHAIGRERRSNDELDDAPISAHVKRTAQEDFTLSDGAQGFSLRRSMPWSDAQHSGLLFASFGKNFEAFEAQLARMVGADDGVTDALYKMSKPVTGSYFWCPPVRDGVLALV